MSNPFAKTYDDIRKPYLEGKMAKKDYDGDGKVETGTQEYMGSRDKAIKKAMGKKVAKEHHQKDADGNPIEHGDGTPSNVEDTYTSAYINELSKKTLGGYVKKASSETRKNMVATQRGSGLPKRARDIKQKQVFKRLRGIEKAGEKMAKEETVNEISMPKNTSYEKMSYKKLKKTHSDFKNMDSKPPRVSVLDKKTGGTVSKPVKFVPDKKPKMKEEFDFIENCPLAEATLGTLHVADMAANTRAWQNRYDTNHKGERLYDFGQDLINAMAEYVDEAKVDKMVPDHKRSGKRLERYGNPHGSLALGGGIQRDRRADHAERRGKKTKGIKKEAFSDWRSEFVWEDGDSAKKLEEAKVDKDKPVKEGNVKNKITINPVVQVESQQQIDENPLKNIQTKLKNFNTNLKDTSVNFVKGLGVIQKAIQNPGTGLNPNTRKGLKMLDQMNEYEPEGEMLEDAKMGRMSDSDLAAAHKKFSGMDQTSPANKFMTKRISREMNRRKKKVSEGFYQKRYAGVGKGYETVGKNKRMDKSNKRSGDSKKQYRELHQDLAKKEETLLTQVTSAYVDEATRMKKEMGYNKGGTKKPTGPKPKDAALDAVKKSITAKYGKGAFMRSGSNQPKKVKGEKPGGGGKYKMMADKKKKTAADAKEMGYGKNVKGYIETRARYGSKANMKAGKGLGT